MLIMSQDGTVITNMDNVLQLQIYNRQEESSIILIPLHSGPNCSLTIANYNNANDCKRVLDSIYTAATCDVKTVQLPARDDIDYFEESMHTILKLSR